MYILPLFFSERQFNIFFYKSYMKKTSQKNKLVMHLQQMWHNFASLK